MLAKEVLCLYDTLFIDLYGVIWDGAQIFEGARELLSFLMNNGKNVVILSNAAVLSKEMTQKYEKKDLIQGVHYTDFVTSGDLLQDWLQGKNFSIFPKTSDFRTYFCLGSFHSSLFEKTNLKRVSKIEEADFVYLSVPQFSDAEKALLPEALQKKLVLGHSRTSGWAWDALDIEPFKTILMQIKAMDKQVLLANPDQTAMNEGKDGKIREVVRQGSLGAFYQMLGGEVIAIGKPYVPIYRYAFQRLAKKTKSKNINLRRCAMIGDSLMTDILGSMNIKNELQVNMDGILVLSGISAKEMQKKNVNLQNVDAVQSFCENTKIVPDWIWECFSESAKIIFPKDSKETH